MSRPRHTKPSEKVEAILDAHLGHKQKASFVAKRFGCSHPYIIQVRERWGDWWRAMRRAAQ